MSRPGPAFRFRARHVTFENLFLRRVAEALAAAPPGVGLLVEARPRGGARTLVPSHAFGPALRGAADGLPGTLERVDYAAPTDPSSPRSFAFLVAGAVEEESSPARATPHAGPASAVPTPFDAPAATSATAVQSHWFPDGGGRLRIWTRVPVGPEDPSGLAPALGIARSLTRAAGAPVRVVVRRARPWDRREWDRGSLHWLRARPALVVPPTAAPASAPAQVDTPGSGPTENDLPTVVLGASGSGKTAYLAHAAALRIERGDPTVVLDVHGDLAPAIVARLSPTARSRVTAIDASEPIGRIAGVDVLGRDEAPGEEREADLVAALKRLSADGTDVYWGFRIERILDAFVRLAREEGGSLVDLAALLTDERRREAARRATRSPDLARFLDELATLLRRSPDYLHAAAARVTRVLGDPRLEALLAPADGGVPVPSVLAERGALLVRVPFAAIGPEATEYAASLLATRLYLTLVRAGRAGRLPSRAWFIADEAHLLAPRLLVEAVADGRKFGVVAVIASQYPERLAPPLRAAAAGAAGTHLVFRVPAAAARAAGAWVGLDAEQSRTLLPTLPVGVGVLARAGEAPTLFEGTRMSSDPTAWQARVDAAARAWGAGWTAERVGDPAATLWSLYEAELGGARGGHENATTSTEAAPDKRLLADLVRKGWVCVSPQGSRVTEAGRAFLGFGARSGAVSESDEHRRLLTAAQRIFARHGERLEVVRQGRFDTRLPDGLLRLAPEPAGAGSPASRLEQLEARRSSWAWRCFGGRDVHVEAEVSGADRPARIRRGLAKGRVAGAQVVFVVGDARRARRVREVVRRTSGPGRPAHVWTVPRPATDPEREPDAR